jgi:aspartyl protease family protein
MSEETLTAEYMYLIALLVFVVSALVARRMPVGQSLKMFAGWIAIFLAVFVAISLKEPILGFFDKVLDERQARTGGVRQGADLRIAQSMDGHFWIEAQVNDRPVRFLVDSGATTTSVSADTAARSGIEPSGGFPVMVDTANGMIEVDRARIARLRIGHIERRNMPIHMSQAFGDTNVLGMNFLSSLSGWRVQGQTLILTP